MEFGVTCFQDTVRTVQRGHITCCIFSWSHLILHFLSIKSSAVRRNIVHLWTYPACQGKGPQYSSHGFSSFSSSAGADSPQVCVVLLLRSSSRYFSSVPPGWIPDGPDNCSVTVRQQDNTERKRLKWLMCSVSPEHWSCGWPVRGTVMIFFPLSTSVSASDWVTSIRRWPVMNFTATKAVRHVNWSCLYSNQFI